MDWETLHNVGQNKSVLLVDELVHNYAVSSDGNINVGDLCEFIDGKVRKTKKTVHTLVKIAASDGQYKPIILDYKRVLLIYTTSIGRSAICCVLLTITNNTITVGTITDIYVGPVNTIYPVLIDENRIYLISTDMKNSPSGQVLTIASDVVTTSPKTVISSGSVFNCNVLKLDFMNILFTFSNSQEEDCTLWGQVITVSDTTYKIGVSTQMTTFNVSCYELSLAGIVGSARYFWASYINDADGLIYYKSFIIRTDVVESDTDPVTLNISGDFANALLDNFNFLVCYIDSTNILKAMVVTRNGVTFSAGPIAEIFAEESDEFQVTRIDSTHAVVSYIDSVDCFVHASLLTINENVIIQGDTITLNSESSYYLYCQSVNGIQVIVSFIESTQTSTYSMILEIKNNNLSISKNISPKILALKDGAADATASFMFSGIATRLIGLVPSATYYCNDNGDLTTTVTLFKIGVALSSTELLIKKPFWKGDLV